MVVNQLDARNIFGRHNRRLPETLIHDDAAEMHDPIAHSDAELHRLPIIFLNGCDHSFPNVIIVSRRIRNISGETCHSPKQVRARHNPYKRISAHNGRRLTFWRSINFTMSSSNMPSVAV